MFENYPKYKFRAKLSAVEHGGYVYGSLIYRYGNTYIEDAITHDLHKVDEDEVDLLVGYIKDGTGVREVYDGDELVGYIKVGTGVREVYDGDEIILDGGGTGYATVSRFIKTEKSKNLDFNEMAAENGWKLKR